MSTVKGTGPQPLRVRGVGRVEDEPRALLVLLSDVPSDNELRGIHDFLRDWTPLGPNRGKTIAAIKALRKGYPNYGEATLAYNTALHDVVEVLEKIEGCSCTMCSGTGFVEGRDYADGSSSTARPCPNCSTFIASN